MVLNVKSVCLGLNPAGLSRTQQEDACLPVHGAGGLDAVDDDDLLAPVRGRRQGDAQHGAQGLGDLHQDRPGPVVHSVCGEERPEHIQYGVTTMRFRVSLSSLVLKRL